MDLLSGRSETTNLSDGKVKPDVEDDGEEEDVEGSHHQQRLLQHQDLVEGVMDDHILDVLLHQIILVSHDDGTTERVQVGVVQLVGRAVHLVWIINVNVPKKEVKHNK